MKTILKINEIIIIFIIRRTTSYEARWHTKMFVPVFSIVLL